MSLSKQLENLANAAMLVTGILLSVILVKQFLLPKPQAARTVQGTNVSLAGVDWSKNGKTLVMALSTKCHFCTESAPFFQRVAKAAGGKVKLLAIFPQPRVEAEDYLAAVGVHVDDVKQAALNSIGVAGTPTLLLVNKAGSVTDVWPGKLSPDKEAEVLRVVENAQSTGK